MSKRDARSRMPDALPPKLDVQLADLINPACVVTTKGTVLGVAKPIALTLERPNIEQIEERARRIRVGGYHPSAIGDPIPDVLRVRVTYELTMPMDEYAEKWAK